MPEQHWSDIQANAEAATGEPINPLPEPHRLVRFIDLSVGSEFMVGNEVWETRAVDMPGDGAVHIWAMKDGNYETFHRRFEESAVCPIYGEV